MIALTERATARRADSSTSTTLASTVSYPSAIRATDAFPDRAPTRFFFAAFAIRTSVMTARRDHVKPPLDAIRFVASNEFRTSNPGQWGTDFHDPPLVPHFDRQSRTAGNAP